MLPCHVKYQKERQSIKFVCISFLISYSRQICCSEIKRWLPKGTFQFRAYFLKRLKGVHLICEEITLSLEWVTSPVVLIWQSFRTLRCSRIFKSLHNYLFSFTSSLLKYHISVSYDEQTWYSVLMACKCHWLTSVSWLVF